MPLFHLSQVKLIVTSPCNNIFDYFIGCMWISRFASMEFIYLWSSLWIVCITPMASIFSQWGLCTVTNSFWHWLWYFLFAIASEEVRRQSMVDLLYVWFEIWDGLHTPNTRCLAYCGCTIRHEDLWRCSTFELFPSSGHHTSLPLILNSMWIGLVKVL